ncbi:MAG: thiamine-phosphate kinase [Magnetococcales bacterium]|nr:thiamine-phosphate kinase [Magnetococcales bacterium]
MKKEQTIASVGEFELIKNYFTPLSSREVAGVIVGIGDDAAQLAIPEGQELVVSTDTLVEGIHFSKGADPYLLGRKSLRVNLSDLAAMGALPCWYFLSLTTPPTTRLDWIKEFSRGLKDDGEDFGIGLVGGDTTGSKKALVVTITVIGSVEKGCSTLRSGARVGDKIFLSGTLGDSALGLAYHLENLKIANLDDRVYLLKRHQLPEPRVVLALALVEGGVTSAAIDVSDGLTADLAHICAASNVGAEVDVEKIPLSAAAKRVLKRHGPDMLAKVLTGGEDYELLFTVAPAMVADVAAIAEKVGVVVTEIGEITAGSSVNINQQGRPLNLDCTGWTHF